MQEGNLYHKDVTQKNFPGKVLGYITPWCVCSGLGRSNQQQQSSGVAVPKHPAQPLGVQAQRCAHCYHAAATCSGLHGVLTTAHSEQRRLLHCYCSHRDTHSIWHAMLAFPKCHTRIQRVNLFCEWLCVVVSCRNSHGYEVATRWRDKFTHVSTFIPPGCDTLVVRHCLLARQCQA